MAQEEALPKINSTLNDILQIYLMLYYFAEKRAREKKIPVPKDFVNPQVILGLNVNNTDDFCKINDTVQQIVRFIKDNKLRNESLTVDDIEKAIVDNIDADNENGRFINHMMHLQQDLECDLKVRSKLEDFLPFAVARDEILANRYNLRSAIKAAAASITKAGFPVDAEKLITNYINMAQKDPKKALEILTTNPATFAPLQIDKAKKGLFRHKPSPEEARKINRDLGKFLKHLKF